jgi:hypothetical protein
MEARNPVVWIYVDFGRSNGFGVPTAYMAKRINSS